MIFMEPIRLWSKTDERALHKRGDDGLLVEKSVSLRGPMERIETSRIEDKKTSQPQNKLQVVETKAPQAYGSRIEVPCCCPGCFSFDF